MEKLQAALQKARQQRAQHPDSADPAAPRKVSSSEAAWAALRPFSPDQRSLEANRIFTVTANEFATPFDILRTKIVVTMRKNNWTRLAITSPTAGCGKTTTACNIAFGLSRHKDMHAVLLEFDLRRPGIAPMLELPDGPGIADVLSRQISFGDQALRFGENIAISPAYRPSSDPTSLILDRRTTATLEEIERTYTPGMMIFDLPPLLASDEARAFLTEVDCALMVTQAETTTTDQINDCEREIADQTNVLGIILNQCRHTGKIDTYS